MENLLSSYCDIKSIYEKFRALCTLLESMDSVVVAFSGGVDSTFLLRIANDVLGERCLAVTATSEVYSERERQEAIELANQMGVKHLIVESEEMAKEEFVNNPPERCYFCKQIRFSALLALAREQGYGFVIDGANADDVNDYRPGQQAARELGVRSPLEEVGLSKGEIRQLSQAMGLVTWDKPSAACLASRIPYGSSISVSKLRQIEGAENLLNRLGFREIRVRHHGDMARIEIPKKDFPRMISDEIMEQVLAELKNLGFTYVTLDLQGLRSGSMNEVLAKEV